VEIFWNDHSEFAPDPVHGLIDFESYQVWRANNWIRPPGMDAGNSPPIGMWTMLHECDLINFIDPQVSDSILPMTLGRNTGLAGDVYSPVCLSDSKFAGLAEEMQYVVDSDIYGLWDVLPPLRRFDGTAVDGMEGLLRWETYPDVLDTFFTVTAREEASGIAGKRSGLFYHYVDTNVPNGLNAYYSVVATDHNLVYMNNVYYPAGYETSEKPANNYQLTIPRTDAQTLAQRQESGLNIYVFPNPATRGSLAEYEAQTASVSDPTGVRITWNNLPLAQNTIQIFTLAGDLITQLNHDGYTEGGSTSWNLMSQNGQEIVSGIYLYVVKSNGGAFEDVPGKFVVIR
jgi:hypothetical protein